MTEYGNGISHGPAGQVSGGGGGGTNPFSGGADIGASVGNFVNDTVHTISTMSPLQLLLLVAVIVIGFIILKRAF